MEILLLALLLMTAKKDNSDLSETLKSALSFYQENRELLTVLLQGIRPSPPPVTEPTADCQEKNRPQPEEGTVGNLNLFEEFLKRHTP